MSKNRLFIASAGSGKTTFLVNEALKQTGNVLITTFTEANEAEIKRKIIQINKAVPGNITVQTWFSFLIQQGVKPFQGSVWDKRIAGLCFVNSQSGLRYYDAMRRPVFFAEKEFERYYFTKDLKVYSDKLSKLVIRCNEKSNGSVIDRISRIYPHIYIDEVQDLAGYDLDIIKLLFQSKSNVLLVGDPRQVTYLTHHERKYEKYRGGKIEQFILQECKSLNCIIDNETLCHSHRNNAKICDFSSKLYPDLATSIPCQCEECRQHEVAHTGIFVLKPDQVGQYCALYHPVVLRDKKAQELEWTFGKSKGLGFDRVLIYPADTFVNYLKTGKLTKTVGGKVSDAFDVAKNYVAITRARHSVAFVIDYDDTTKFIDGIVKYIPE